jgi:hypothetical protein
MLHLIAYLTNSGACAGILLICSKRIALRQGPVRLMGRTPYFRRTARRNELRQPSPARLPV